jgi:Na+-translocating ferredoxin:NAD+ oxidoreductase subunit B
MDTQLITTSVISLSLLGAVSGLLLWFAAEKFKVVIDPMIEDVLKLLPGANCGACGFPSCASCAEAIVSGKAEANACKVGGAATAEKVAAKIGSGKCEVGELMVAHVFCGGTLDKSGRKFKYTGIRDCDAAILVNGGDKICNYGCLGYGTCVKACKFGAMTMPADGIPKINKEKCVACGKCIAACPRKLISYIPKTSKAVIDCSSYDKGSYVRGICKVGCIKCHLCEKNCPTGAVKFTNDLPKIDNNICTGNFKCVEVCPQKTIVKL